MAPINDTSRAVKCGNCQLVTTPADLMQSDAECPRCKAELCVYCGCTDNAACMHPDFPPGQLNCEWLPSNPGVCNFCHCELVENAYREVNGLAPKEYVERLRPAIVQPLQQQQGGFR